MKALVVTNCATAAYASGLRALFPGWEVKGAEIQTARKWLGKEPNKEFRAFLSDADLLLLGTENKAEFAEFARGKEVLSIPSFWFHGLHPDSVRLRVGGRIVPSVLRIGNLHSRLAVSAFVLGLSQERTVAAFNGITYETAGYFSLFEFERERLFQRFKAEQIDLTLAFDRWCKSQEFLYTSNHPHAFVFNDILVAALGERYLDERTRQSATVALASVPDYLESSIRWPVYPEIAVRHGLKSNFLWRTGANAGPITMTAGEFIAATFDTLSRYPGLDAECVLGFDACRAALAD